jgi:hypothetical protein
MSKRLVVKTTLAIAALGATTLLSGCSDEVVIGAAWAPVGYVPLFVTAPVGMAGGAGGSGQTATGGSTGVGGVGAGGYGGGNQVSTGMAVQ